jgi:hypothetical protein
LRRARGRVNRSGQKSAHGRWPPPPGNAARRAVAKTGGGDYLVVQTQGCRGAGDEMFCSARGGWSDLAFDRKTQACSAIE